MNVIDDTDFLECDGEDGNSIQQFNQCVQMDGNWMRQDIIMY